MLMLYLITGARALGTQIISSCTVVLCVYLFNYFPLPHEHSGTEIEKTNTSTLSLHTHVLQLKLVAGSSHSGEPWCPSPLSQAECVMNLQQRSAKSGFSERWKRCQGKKRWKRRQQERHGKDKKILYKKDDASLWLWNVVPAVIQDKWLLKKEN